MPRLISFVLVLGMLVSCKHRQHVVTRGFYYWKTRYNVTGYEKKSLEQLGVQKMYIRLFDVDWNDATKKLFPVAIIKLPRVTDTTLGYVPVIFLTQKTLVNLNHGNITDLSEKINNLSAALCAGSGIRTEEIQIDCDWTATTKEAYFALLTALKQQPFLMAKSLSCTIRMHQIKYAISSGIPPVDRGLLMCYNMGDMKKPGAHNSILEVATAEKYLSGINKYPLDLDIALPLFSWSLLFRDQRFVGILRDLYPGMISENSLFSRQHDNLYQCKRDTTWNGYTLKTNDLIRTESVSQNTLEEIATYTSRRIRNNKLNVIFFSCDSITLSKHSPDELEVVYNSYL